MKTFDVARKDLLRSFRSMFFWMFGLGAPLLMAGVFYFAFGGAGGDEPIELPVTRVQAANLDETAAGYGGFTAGALLVDLFESDSFSELLIVTRARDAGAARAAVDAQEADVAVVVPAGFTAAALDPLGRAEVEVYHDPTLTVGPGIVAGIASQFVDGLAGARIAAGVTYEQLAAQGAPPDSALLQEVAGQYAAWSAALGEGSQTGDDVLLDVRSLGGEQVQAGSVGGTVGPILAAMTVFYAFFTGAASAMSILQEQEGGTLYRLFATPTARSSVLGGKFVATLLVVIVQIVALMAAGRLVFGVAWGAPLPLALATIGVVVLAAGFGIFVTSLLRDTRQTGIVYGGVMTVMGMMGISPVFMGGAASVSTAVRIVPLVVPQGWAMDALQRAMAGGDVGDVLPSLAVMLALAVVFFLVGVFRFGRRFA